MSDGTYKIHQLLAAPRAKAFNILSANTWCSLMKFLLAAKSQKATPEGSHRDLLSDELTRQGEEAAAPPRSVASPARHRHRLSFCPQTVFLRQRYEVYSLLSR